MNWVFLSLLAPLFWALSNFIDKYILEKHTKNLFDYMFFSTITSWLFFIVITLFIGIPEINWYFLIPISTGVMLIYSYGFYGKALEQSETSSLVLLFSLIPLITVFLAFIFLGQTLSLREIVGSMIVLFGAVVVSFEKSKGVVTKGLGMILIAIIIWSAVNILVAYGLTKMSFWDYFILENLGSALAGVVLLVIPSMRQQVIEGIKTAGIQKYFWFFWNNSLDFLGQMSIKKALSLTSAVGLVAVITQVQSFYAILIGVLLTLLVPQIMKEDITVPTLLKKSIGAVIMFIGIYFLSV